MDNTITTITDLEKPSIRNGGIKPFQNDNARLEVHTARKEVTKYTDLITKGEWVNAQGESNQAKLVTAKENVSTLLERHDITLTERGIEMLKLASSRGFGKTLNLVDGVDVHLTQEQAIDLTEREEEHDKFCLTEDGQEYQRRINDQHQRSGYYAKTRHSLKFKEGRSILSTNFTMESAIGDIDAIDRVDSKDDTSES